MLAASAEGTAAVAEARAAIGREEVAMRGANLHRK